MVLMNYNYCKKLILIQSSEFFWLSVAINKLLQKINFKLITQILYYGHFNIKSYLDIYKILLKQMLKSKLFSKSQI